MIYRKEIDGLRAVSVLSVLFFHAEIEIFRGGFFGVDVFFVISGFLITQLICDRLERGNFNLLEFYERRARRILPALFLVMGFSFALAHVTLMPDEYKNFGQSLIATSLFSNNILLAITSGYWDLASEFKPLLHTWSLGVEEQYYTIVPIFLMFMFKFAPSRIIHVFVLIFFSSFVFSIYYFEKNPDWAFYILPTRAWEIVLGALAALWLRSPYRPKLNFAACNLLSFAGLLLILFSIFSIDETTPSLTIATLLSTVGATLIVLFAIERTLAHRFLTTPLLVYIGLISYSLYLFHQPIFAFIRIISVNQPTALTYVLSIPLVFACAHLSWRFVETPFRSTGVVSARKFVWLAAGCTCLFVASGFLLNQRYGLPERVFDANIALEDMDKRIYNERAFLYQADAFQDPTKVKILIVGNSFARDFVNITLETFDTTNVEIVYRADLKQCIGPSATAAASGLFASADVIVFGSGEVNTDCLQGDLDFGLKTGKQIYYIGTKHFGYNLNWLIRLAPADRPNQFNEIEPEVIQADQEMARIVPARSFISLLAPTLVGRSVPITDDLGRMISTDRTHLTKFGAIYFGRKAVLNTSYAEFFRK